MIRARARLRRALAVAVAVVGVVAPVSRALDTTCATTPSLGGDWPQIGNDLTSTRTQPAEHTISGSTATFLQPAWTFDANFWTKQPNNEVTGYPIEADGCVFVGSSTGNDSAGAHLPGWVFALNADTGMVVWQTKVDGGVYSTVAVDHGVVYGFVSRVGSPFVVALDEATGRVLWQTTVENLPGSDAVSSPIVYDGVVWVGVSGTAAEGDAADRTAFQGSSVLLATDTTRGKAPGQVLAKAYTVPPALWSQGYAGGAQWGTIAVDTTTGYGYVPTGNPFDYQEEHENTNAILKLDLRRGSSTFGTFVGSYKGNVDQYVPQSQTAPACRELTQVNIFVAGLDCVHLDLDFGVTPNVFTDATGRRVVAAGQKSGVLHFIDADTMNGLGTVSLGTPTAAGGIVGSAAFDGTNLYGPHTIGGYLWSVGATTRTPRWVTPTADGVHWGPPVTYAEGLVWTVDLKGFLDAYDANTGTPIEHLPMNVGTSTGTNPTFSWGGVTIARHTIFASVGIGLTSAGEPSMPDGFVIAYRTKDPRSNLTGLGG
jgi:polyvinyl alcohol dehydrogenase (cytochrome)